MVVCGLGGGGRRLGNGGLVGSREDANCAGHLRKEALAMHAIFTSAALWMMPLCVNQMISADTWSGARG